MRRHYKLKVQSVRKRMSTNPWFKSFSVLSSQILTCNALPSRTRLNISSITQKDVTPTGKNEQLR